MREPGQVQNLVDLVLVAYFTLIARSYAWLIRVGFPQLLGSLLFYTFLPQMLLTICARAYRRKSLGYGGE